MVLILTEEFAFDLEFFFALEKADRPLFVAIIRCNLDNMVNFSSVLCR
jgi:hypothetical protein